MISLQVVFWLLLLLFAAIGAIRGWVREILVMAALMVAFVIVSLFFRGHEPLPQVDENSPLQWYFVVPQSLIDPQAPPDQYVPVRFLLQDGVPDHAAKLRSQAMVRFALLAVFAFIGYETSGLGRFAGRLGASRFQDRLLGAFLGLLNGYLLIGSAWYYLAGYGYPFSAFSPPESEPLILRYMAPVYLMRPLVSGVASAWVLMLIVIIFVLIALL